MSMKYALAGIGTLLESIIGSATDFKKQCGNNPYILLSIQPGYRRIYRFPKRRSQLGGAGIRLCSQVLSRYSYVPLLPPPNSQTAG